ncbi:MAG: hypothetical protein MUO18_07125 [Methanomassiliicoccales archaeon]|nr:hypothetical protein [Methanomassiliicoccales archaeon]
MSVNNRMMVNLKSLTRVIENRVGISESAAKDLALRLLNYFGFGESIIDNSLDQEDRRLFYFFQDLKLLKTHWEEAVLLNGRIWRIFYWDLNVDDIARELRCLGCEEPEELGLYDSLPDEAWSRERSAEIA